MTTNICVFFLCCFAIMSNIIRIESSNKQEIEDLFDKIRGDHEFITEQQMLVYFRGKDTSDIKFLMGKFGIPYKKGKRSYRKLDLKQLSTASDEGFIPKFPLCLLSAQFNKIILKDEDRDYILLNDLIVYYCGPRYQKTKAQMEKIMKDYGEPYDEVQRLCIGNFKRVLNLGLLPSSFV